MVSAEIEHSINTRFLTHVSLDLNKKEALTPNHFLLGRSSGMVRMFQHENSVISLKEQWVLAQQLSDT